MGNGILQNKWIHFRICNFVKFETAQKTLKYITAMIQLIKCLISFERKQLPKIHINVH